MHETLILSIAAAEASALVTTRRLWRAAAFAVLLTAVVVHAALALGSSAPACALPALVGAGAVLAGCGALKKGGSASSGKGSGTASPRAVVT